MCRKHYSDLLNENISNVKRTWQILKSIVNKNKANKIQDKFKLSDGTLTSDKSIISTKFNEFCIRIGPNLAHKIPNQRESPLHFMGQPTVNSIYLSEVTPEEIIKILQSLKNGAAGYDGLSSSLLKMVGSLIVNPLAYICNLSLKQGVFPTELKIANVLPLYKSDDPFCFNNYRPVSLLCVLSKVFEKVMYNRLLDFLEDQKFFVNEQFGFRKLHSSYMALMILIDKLIESLDRGEYVIGIFLDFSKAFDTVDHKILLQKLYHYGIRGPAYDWFYSYLTDRKQYVTYNGMSSNTKNVMRGVPQGSILGPLLFLVYINDLCSVCEYATPILFADDTNLFCSGKDLQTIQMEINTALTKISTWLKVNKLSLNIKKTHYMVFTRKKFRHQLDIRIDGHLIDEVHKTKFLGVYIDNKLNWKDHVSYLIGKISKGIGMIIKARQYLNKKGLIALYYSFIYPYLIYCNHIWGCTYKSSLKKLVTLQNKIVRIITCSKPRDSSQPLYEQLKILKLSDINKYLIGRFMFRYCNGQIPRLFDSFFFRNHDFHEHNTRISGHFHIISVKSDLSKTGIRYRGAVIWNTILHHGINHESSEAVFVKLLKKILYDLP